MGRAQPCLWKSKGQTLESWRPTTLDELGKKEEFLEEIIFREPRLLDLESLETGIRGPYLGFRQIAFQTPQGRPIRPDIVFLTAGGHVVVVEVKRASNPELRDRQVIAQVVDYAGSFAQLSEDQLFRLFQPGVENGREAATWPDWIALQFPDTDDPDELADILMARFRDGELHLCIVCDKAPSGIRELVEGVASQSALGFDLSLVEVQPYVREGHPEEILFMPSTPLRTEIISRTAVRFSHEPGTERPIIQITVDSAQVIQEAIQKPSTRRGQTPVTLALESVKESLQDLIGKGIVLNVWVWHKFILVAELDLETVGRIGIDVAIGRFGDDSDESMSVALVLRGKRDLANRMADLQMIVKATKHVLPDGVVLIGTGIFETGDDRIYWEVKPLVAKGESMSPDIIANYAERVFRHFAGSLPVRRKSKQQ